MTSAALAIADIAPLPTGSFGGCEIAMFRPRAGVSDQALRDACQRMRAEFLSEQAGFIDHALIGRADGMYADVVFADTQADAEAICSLFMQHPACLAYLELIEPGTPELTFWRRIV